MNKTLPTLVLAATAAVVAVLAPLPSYALDAKDDTFEPDKGVNPDQTTRERYRAAVKQADDRLARNLAQCETMAASDKADCVRAANDQHDSDAAAADDFRRRPR